MLPSGAPRQTANNASGNCLRRPLAPTFRVGGIGLFIPWRVVAAYPFTISLPRARDEGRRRDRRYRAADFSLAIYSLSYRVIDRGAGSADRVA
jgi:hypothetical protein